jgi:hypothetical protein
MKGEAICQRSLAGLGTKLGLPFLAEGSQKCCYEENCMEKKVNSLRLWSIDEPFYKFHAVYWRSSHQNPLSSFFFFFKRPSLHRPLNFKSKVIFTFQGNFVWQHLWNIIEKGKITATPNTPLINLSEITLYDLNLIKKIEKTKIYLNINNHYHCTLIIAHFSPSRPSTTPLFSILSNNANVRHTSNFLN